jgi:hypothetical protein
MLDPNPFTAPFFNYFQDAFERSALFLDVLRGETITSSRAIEQPQMS